MASRSEVERVLEGVHLTMKYRQTDSGWWIAYCDEVPEARTQGATKDEARENLKDAVGLVLEDCTVEQLHEFRESVMSEQSELLAL